MDRRRLIAVVAVLLATVVILVLRNQLKVDENRRIREREARLRESLFAMLQPVALTNCQLERFGERHDGGYLMCGNLLGQHDESSSRVIERLKTFFHLAHIHFNNAGCTDGLAPFPSYAYEGLFVNKRLGHVDSSGRTSDLHRLDAPNNPTLDDCQPAAR